MLEYKSILMFTVTSYYINRHQVMHNTEPESIIIVFLERCDPVEPMQYANNRMFNQAYRGYKIIGTKKKKKKKSNKKSSFPF